MNTSQETTTAGAKSPRTPRTEHLSKDGKWRYFPKVPNLLQYVRTGTYFARTKVEGKTIRLSLETDVWTTAKLTLPDKLKEIRKPRPALGTFGQARERYEQDLENDHTLKDNTRRYRKFCLRALRETWPTLDGIEIQKISPEACRSWASRFVAEGYDEQYFNNTLGTLRKILEAAGVRSDDNPALKVKRLGIKNKELQLPERAQFEKILTEIEDAGARQSQQCADLVRFLAYSGCRISEARKVKWGDIALYDPSGRRISVEDFRRLPATALAAAATRPGPPIRGEIKVENAKRSKTSNASKFRQVPIIPDMLLLLHRLRSRYEELAPTIKDRFPELEGRVCLVGECEKSLTNACKRSEAKRITHHDLRHLFATRCIEGGVDIPTVSRWLGHVDGGALAMKVYGHLRREHSAAMAQRVTFGVQENVTPVDFSRSEGSAA